VTTNRSVEGGPHFPSRAVGRSDGRNRQDVIGVNSVTHAKEAQTDDGKQDMVGYFTFCAVRVVCVLRPPPANRASSGLAKHLRGRA
jgi:hypothetical protein